MFIIIITYRARDTQVFRREQLIRMLDNVNTYFTKHNVEYKIIVCEQNNENKFNRGQLLNIGFIEANKMFDVPKKYIHMNVDYFINSNMPFPQELLDFESGVLDIYQPYPFSVLGAACCFDYDSYVTINGFPNNLFGWGGDDGAALKRIKKTNVHYFWNKLTNSGWICEEHVDFDKDFSANDMNNNKADTENYLDSGLNNCHYTVDGYGEFHGNNIIHLLTNFYGE
jgi:hypothetical protein